MGVLIGTFWELLRPSIRARQLEEGARTAATDEDPLAALSRLCLLANRGDTAVRRKGERADEALLILTDGIMSEVIRRSHVAPSSASPVERRAFGEMGKAMAPLQLRMRERHVFDLEASARFAEELRRGA